MTYSRERWHSGLIYRQTCSECNTTFSYDDYKLDYRPWFADGFVYCPKCRKPLRHNENFAIKEEKKADSKQENAIESKATNTKFCQHCGTKIDKSAKFCPSCGEKTLITEGETARVNKPIEENGQANKVTAINEELLKRLEEIKKAEEIKKQEDAKKTEDLLKIIEAQKIENERKLEEIKKAEQAKVVEQLKKEKTIKKATQKCPNCGEILNSFILVCPSCGCEVRGQEVSFAINEFVNIINNCEDEKKVSNIIRTFPIPNNKEDLYEFLLIAKSNVKNYDLNGDGILNDNEKELMLAWITKFDQCYDKAKILFSDEKDLALFEKANQEMEKTRNKIAKNKITFSKEKSSQNIREEFKKARGTKTSAILGSVLSFVSLTIASTLGGSTAVSIALLMWASFIFVFLLGSQAIRIKIRKIYILPAVLGYLLFMVYLFVLVYEVS